MFYDDTDWSDADNDDSAPETTRSRAARDAQRRRNALARHKLELMKEHKRLREQLTEVWEETDAPSDFSLRLYNSRQPQEVKDVTVTYQ